MSSPVCVGLKRGTNDKDITAKIKRAMDLSEDLSAHIKKTKDNVAGILNKPQAVATSRRQEPWCRLISQYTMVRLLFCFFTSLSISRTHP
jgi:hypothetical protein